MCTPKAPPPPDPNKVAAAQTDQSVATALANTMMGQVNRVGPDGSLTYDQTGDFQFTGPGGTYTIPRFTATETLTPEGQQIQAANNGARLNLANIGREQSGRLGELLNRPVDLGAAPAAADRSVSRLPTYGAGPSAPGYSQINGGENYEELGAGPGYQRMGAGPQYERMDAGGDYENLGAGPGYQRLDDDAGLVDSYRTDRSGDRKTYEDALMARINPQLDRQRETIQRELAGRGVRSGSAAYDRAMNEYGETANDARYGAILNASNEQARLEGLDRDAGTFTNSSRQQSYSNRTGETSYNNQVTGMERADEIGRVGQNNQVMQQRLADRMGVASFNNDAAARGRADEMASAGFNNQAAGMERADEIGRVGQNNTVMAQRLADRMGIAGFNNDAASRGFSDQMLLTGRDDANANATFSMGMSELDAQDRSRAQALNEQFAVRNQPLQELLSIMNGTALQNPNFDVAMPDRIANTDIAGIQQQGYANEMAAYQARLAQQQAMMGGMFDLGAAFIGRPPT